MKMSLSHLKKSPGTGSLAPQRRELWPRTPHNPHLFLRPPEPEIEPDRRNGELWPPENIENWRRGEEYAAESDGAPAE